MSVAIPLSELRQQNKNIAKDLTVRPVENKARGTFQSSFPIEAYSFTDTHAFLPFSYTFLNFPELFKTPKTPNIDFKFTGSLLDRQKAIKDKAIELLNEFKTVMLCLHTGFGKTIFGIYLISKIGKKALVLCHRKIIIDQWVEAVKKYIPSASVGVLDQKLIDKTEADSLPDILIANVITVTKFGPETFKDYGLLVLDEIHTMCTEQNSKSLFNIFPNYIIGLSATPFRTDGMDRLNELYAGPFMITRKMNRIFSVYKIRTGCTFDPKRQMDGSLDWNSVLECQVLHENRNQLIVDLCNFFCHRNILVLVKRKDHAIMLKNMCIKLGIDVDVFFGTAKVVNYTSRVLIATYSKGGVGFDHPKLDMLITAADVEENFIQYLGRIFRRDETTPIYVDLVDDLSTIKKHSTTRMKVCKDIGGVVHDFIKVFPDFMRLASMLRMKKID